MQQKFFERLFLTYGGADSGLAEHTAHRIVNAMSARIAPRDVGSPDRVARWCNS